MLWWNLKVCRRRKVPLVHWLDRLHRLLAFIKQWITWDNRSFPIKAFWSDFFLRGSFWVAFTFICYWLLPCFFFFFLDASILSSRTFFNTFWKLVMVCFKFEGEISTLKRIISACELHTTHVFIFSLKFEFWESSGQTTKLVCHFSSVICIFLFHGIF